MMRKMLAVIARLPDDDLRAVYEYARERLAIEEAPVFLRSTPEGLAR